MSVQVLISEPRKLRAVVRRLSDVQPTSIDWIWPGRIAMGKFTLLAGEPGLGKSLLTLDIAARVSRGSAWPEGDSCAERGSVLLLSGEDDVADTVVPRLTALGADLSQVRVLESIRHHGDEEDAPFTLAIHLAQLDEALAEMESPRLVIIDPISSYLRGVSPNSNAAVRRMLTSLGQLAQRRQVGVLAVTHLAKNTYRDVLGRALGSIAFVAAARAVWFVARDPMNGTRQLLLQVKNNLRRRDTGLAFKVVSAEEGNQPRLEWDQTPCLLSAAEVARLERELLKGDVAKPKTPRQEAGECLRELLADGPRLSRNLLREAEDQGFADKTIRRALRDMGAHARRSDMGDYYYLLPGQEKDVPETGVWMWLQDREMSREMG